MAARLSEDSFLCENGICLCRKVLNNTSRDLNDRMSTEMLLPKERYAFEE